MISGQTASTKAVGSRRRRLRIGIESIYIATFGVIAIVGISSEGRRPLLALAALLSLPCGFGALVGLYALTGIFNSIASGFSGSTVSRSYGGCSPNGHCWSVTTGTPVGAQGSLFESCVVLVFVGAALANVLILRSVQKRRRAANTRASQALKAG